MGDRYTLEEDDYKNAKKKKNQAASIVLKI
jgi:hypothetical protein